MLPRRENVMKRISVLCGREKVCVWEEKVRGREQRQRQRDRVKRPVLPVDELCIRCKGRKKQRKQQRKQQRKLQRKEDEAARHRTRIRA